MRLVASHDATNLRPLDFSIGYQAGNICLPQSAQRWTSFTLCTTDRDLITINTHCGSIAANFVAFTATKKYRRGGGEIKKQLYWTRWLSHQTGTIILIMSAILICWQKQKINRIISAIYYQRMLQILTQSGKPRWQ